MPTTGFEPGSSGTQRIINHPNTMYFYKSSFKTLLLIYFFISLNRLFLRQIFVLINIRVSAFVTSSEFDIQHFLLGKTFVDSCTMECKASSNLAFDTSLTLMGQHMSKSFSKANLNVAYSQAEKHRYIVTYIGTK